MNYFIKKLKDAFGNLHEEVDPVRGIYVLGPVKPSSSATNLVAIPDGKKFYPFKVEVENDDTADHHFHLADKDGNQISLEYKVAATDLKEIDFKHSGLDTGIQIVEDTYDTMTFRIVGYLVPE